MLSVLFVPLLACASLTGLVRIAGVTYTNLGGRTPLASMGPNFALAVLVAMGLATIVVLVIALLLRGIIGSPFPAARVDYDYDIDAPRPQRPRKRSGPRDLWKDDRPYPPPNDPYWDDR